MKLEDYLISPVGYDWNVLLKSWADILPDKFSVRGLNCFGDVFVELPDGSVRWLDVQSDQVRPTAPDWAAFCADEASLENWLLWPLVDTFIAAGCNRQPNEIYNLYPPPMLGGEYVVDNARAVPIEEFFLFYSDLAEQVRDLPDGALVRIKVVD